MSNAITTTKQLLDKRLDQMLKVVAATDRDRFRQAAIGVAQSKNIADCTPDSILSSIYYCFRWGFSPDPAMRQVAIIPFREKGIKVAKPIIMYNGVIDLARNADPSLQLRTGVVYENDDFELIDGTTRKLNIKLPHWLAMKEPGQCLFSWCAYRTATQAETETVIVPFHELFDLQKRANEKTHGGTPWITNFPAMAEKTAILRAGKKWTMAPHSEGGRRMREVLSAADDEELPQLDTSGNEDREISSSGLQSAIDAANAAKTKGSTSATGGGMKQPNQIVQSDSAASDGGDHAGNMTEQGGDDKNSQSPSTAVTTPAPPAADAEKYTDQPPTMANGSPWNLADMVAARAALSSMGVMRGWSVANLGPAVAAFVKLNGSAWAKVSPKLKDELWGAVWHGALSEDGKIG